MGEAPASTDAGAGPRGPAFRVIEWWAVFGGVVLLGVALMTAWSAATSLFFGRPLPGDFELTEILVAVAVFAFLPYCQLTGANVTADLFTAHAGPRAIGAFGMFASLLALGISVLLAWRTWAGLLDYRQFVETTAILKIPIWTAYVPALASLALLVFACLITLMRSWRVLRGG
jgi:TRAP-type C4-dicarboxylate transport system permease small subunit